MRSGKLFGTATAAVLWLVLAPAGALAHKHPSPGGRCRISINIAPREIVAGDPVVIFGRLVCRDPANEANKVVRLFHHGPNRRGFSFIQNTTTDANGFYEFSRADDVVNTNRAWYVRSRGAQSASKAIRVAAEVTLSATSDNQVLMDEGQVQTGFAHRVTFTGTVSPADVGARVVLQRQNDTAGDQWHRIDAGRVAAGGSFRIVHAFRIPGDANIRVLVRSRGRNIPSPSNVLAYVISQAQNPALTIQASADPIAFGHSVTISGILAGGASTPVTLLARIARQHSFAPVAQVPTDASGSYSFPEQSPVFSTFYKVTGAHKSSAVLYEGVKDVLIAKVSATSVQVGQSLTFSGTVEPDHTGHVIYLERLNASGTGFHVRQVSVVRDGSAFSIVHQFYDAGTKVFRVYIPGGPENQGAASQLFTIQVGPAVASTLTQESQSNSTSPSEGQT